MVIDSGLLRLSLCAICVSLLPQHTLAACISGYTDKTDGCYKVFKNTAEMTAAEAESLCNADDSDSHLASVQTTGDNTLYKAEFPTDTRIWIGLKRKAASHPIWHYISDGLPVQNQGCYRYNGGNTDFRDFALAAPTRGVTYQTCVNYCKGKPDKYAYAAVTGTPGAFSCGCAEEGFSKDKQFDLGATPGDSGCIQMCDGSTERCGELGFMVVLSLVGVGYDRWAYQQTNNFDGYQTCAAMLTNRGKKYGDELCTQQYPYICQDADLNLHVHMTSEDQVNWFKARNNCKGKYPGGDLAKLNDISDLDSLPALPNNMAFWTGLTNTEWEWKNGAPLDWSNWERYEPEWKGNECAYMDRNSGLWRDEDCSATYTNFVCEINVIPDTTAPDSATTMVAATTDKDSTMDSTGNTNSPATSLSSTTGPTSNHGNNTIVPTPAANHTTTSPSVITANNTTIKTTTTTTTTTTNPITTTTTTSGTTTTTKVNNNPTTPTTTTTNTNGNGSSNGGTGTTRGPGTAGGSTGGSGNSLTTLEIILIVLCLILLILIITLIVLVCYYKRKNNRKNKIHDYDARRTADVPYSGSLGDEVYLPATTTVANPDSTSDGSTTSSTGSDYTDSSEDLIRQNGKLRSRTEPEGRIRSDSNDRY